VISAAEYGALDAVGLASAMARGEVSPEEIEMAFRECAGVGYELNAWAECYDDIEFRRVAGPLSGVPIVRKDLGNPEQGRLKEYGSPLGEGLRSHVESVFFKRLKRAGGLLVGRSRVPEFGLSVTTESHHYGHTDNPYGVGFSAGGSSGGSAALVSAGVVPIGHGDDGGGSLRIPASCCGIIGLKPTRGRVSNSPWAGEDLLGLDQAFVLTRSVRDARLLLSVLGVAVPGDPFVPGEAPRQPSSTRPTRSGALRVGVVSGRWGDSEPDPEHVAAVAECGAQLEALGSVVELVDIKFPFEEYCEVLLWVFAEASCALAESLSMRSGRPVSSEFLQHNTLEWIKVGRSRPAWSIYNTFDSLNLISRVLGNAFRSYDIVITPTVAGRPPRAGCFMASVEGFNGVERLNREFEDYVQYCGAFNISGHPAVSIPYGLHSDGLPNSVQIVGKFGREVDVLDVAEMLIRPAGDPLMHITKRGISGRG
jgi:amidase